MAIQNFKNHTRYYTPHHFIFYPLLLVALIAAIVAYNHHPEQRQLWMAVIAMFIFVGWSSYMMRQHYALGNQNRIVRLELRFRYFVVTGKRLELLESNLSFNQLAALRFASDEELAALVERALKENLSAGEIKKLIVHWLPDHMRVQQDGHDNLYITGTAYPSRRMANMAFLSRHLYIRRSSIPTGGRGLFTRKMIRKGSRIVEYKGKVTTWKEVDHRGGTNGYIYFINRKHVLDAFTYRKALARYANDARGMKRKKGLKNNAAYETIGLKVYIDALEDIPAGSEILVGYGQEYWDALRYNQNISNKG